MPVAWLPLLASLAVALPSARPAAWLLTQAQAPSAARPYQADLSRSTVRFKAVVNQFLVKEVKASFGRFSFDGDIDAADPANSRARIVIDMGSVSSETFGVSDATLKSELDVAAHPQAVVETVAVRRGAQPDAYEADVEARFKGQTLRSTLRVKVVRFNGYLRLLGVYSTQPDAQGRKAEIEFSMHLSPR